MVSLLYCVNIHRLWVTEKIRKNENGINSADNFTTSKVFFLLNYSGKNQNLSHRTTSLVFYFILFG